MQHAKELFGIQDGLANESGHKPRVPLLPLFTHNFKLFKQIEDFHRLPPA